MKKREIPKKNYIILLVIAVLVVGICFYLATWYTTINDHYKTHSIIVEVIPEIETDTFTSFLLDNPNTVVYVSSSSDADVKSFEKKFKKIIIDNALNSSIIYFDINKEGNENGLEYLANNYMSKELKNITEIPVPNLLLFENGEIAKILYSNKSTITTKDVNRFLNRNGIIEND